MTELLVMRHAKSDWSLGLRDFDRPLNDRGTRAAARMGEWLSENDLAPDLIISSSAERTRRTVDAVILACGTEQVQFFDELYHATATTWLAHLRRQEVHRVLLCGHNPGLDDLVETLAIDAPPLNDTGKLMTTAAVAHFSFSSNWDSITPRSGLLHQLVRPREMER